MSELVDTGGVIDMREDRQSGTSRLHAIVRTLIALVCIGCLAAAGSLAAHGALEEHVYRAVGGGESADDSWQAVFPEAIAWLTVERTDISYPVMQPAATEPADFYLTHNAWGEPSAAGCPYLDPRCLQTGAHLLVYGHATGFPSRMFEPLREAYRPEVFAQLGAARWQSAMSSGDAPQRSTRAPDVLRQDATVNSGAAQAVGAPAAGASHPAPPRRADTLTPIASTTTKELAFQPLCALRVDQSFADIQRFSLNAGADVAAFARTLAAQAQARAPSWEEQAQRAKRVLTLITCTSPLPGARERTLVVFTLS